MTLCLEQTLGHRAHSKNLERAGGASSHQLDVVQVHYPEQSRVPIPWTLRASVDGARQLRRRPASGVTLFHTQSVGLLAGYATRGRPFVVSVDATPHQVDGMGAWYKHNKSIPPLEAAKDWAYRRTFHRANAVVAWSEWAAAALVDEYGVPRDKITVVHPGAGPEFFELERAVGSGCLPRILFVGGDFERKGGPLLLRAFSRLNGRAELCLVTGAPVLAQPGVTVVANATPGSPELLAAYASADIFCLPTFADCTSVAIGEAMAAGLAVATTRVGSNEDAVAHGDSGLLVEPGAEDELFETLSGLVADAALRHRLAANARCVAHERMDAATNAQRILKLMERVA